MLVYTLFSLKQFEFVDLVVIDRILNIELKDLISPFIKVDSAKHIKKVLIE